MMICIFFLPGLKIILPSEASHISGGEYFPSADILICLGFQFLSIKLPKDYGKYRPKEKGKSMHKYFKVIILLNRIH